MGFADHYIHSLSSTDLRDDATHYATEALFAAAVADTAGAGLGALLSRAKYAEGAPSKMFKSGPANLAQLLRVWGTMVRQKGIERKWVRMAAAWDVQAAYALFDRVAAQSLAHWLDGRCRDCRGSGQTSDRRLCPCCKGSGRADLPTGGFEREKVLDMVAELEGYLQSHNRRAAKRLRTSVHLNAEN